MLKMFQSKTHAKIMHTLCITHTPSIMCMTKSLLSYEKTYGILYRILLPAYTVHIYITPRPNAFHIQIKLSHKIGTRFPSISDRLLMWKVLICSSLSLFLSASSNTPANKKTYNHLTYYIRHWNLPIG